MSRSVHLLLDFLKETGDHRMLLDLAIQLKYTPDLDKYGINIINTTIFFFNVIETWRQFTFSIK